MKSFTDRVAVITGAGGGIGSALADELAVRGCHVALVDVNAESIAKTAGALARHPVKVSQHVADVTDAARMEALPGEVVAEHGGVNLLINNAGITLQKSFETHSLADWERVIGINLWGVLYGCRFFLDTLRAADEAHIVNLSSMSGFLGMPGQSSYCATKAAVKGLSESLWAEFAVYGIGVTSVHPGAIRTEMIQATIAESDDVAAAQRNYELAHKIGTDADRAARIILDAVEKNKLRVRVGRDAVLLDWLKRIAPVGIHKPFLKVARQQLGPKQS
jgi:NAD(P)-dependent dehydrogenase (short-subunit alcohol dehydrogenase family)